MTYDVICIKEMNKKFGIQYKLKNMMIDVPKDKDSSRIFLYEIISENQADVLLDAYPDIINKIIKNDLKDIDFDKTKGIKEVTFSKIKKKVIENFVLIDIVNLFDGCVTMSTIKKMYEKYTSVELLKNKLSKNPYKCLCGISRVGFKSADEILLRMENSKSKNIEFDEDLRSSKQRMLACIDYILLNNESNGNTQLDIKELRIESYKLTPECIGHFVDIIKNEENMIYVDYDNKIVSRKVTHDAEVYIAKVLKNAVKVNNKWYFKTELYRDCNNVSLTDEQLNSLDNLCNYNVSIVTASAGSGKSMSVKNMISMLEDNGKTFLLCTPTGKSSEVLGDYCDRDAGTIHRQLDYNPANKNGGWGYNEENKLTVDVVFIDEFGMTDVYLMQNLLKAIDVNKTKIVLVFDSYQLSSVGCGNIAHDILTSKVIPTTILTKIFRYNEGGLMQVATKIRNSEKFLDSDFKDTKIFGSNKDFIYSETFQMKIIQKTIKIYNKLIKEGYKIEDILILVAQNKGDYGTKAINASIQKSVQQGKNNRFIMRGKDKFYKGDKVIQICNNYKAMTPLFDKEHVYNGNTGIIIDVDYNFVTVDFGNKQILYKKEELNQLELGYCISIHKSQGSQAKQVIVLSPKSHTFMLNSNLLYVAVTRAKERVFMLGNIITINSCIKKKENLNRKTCLKDLIINQ